MSQEVGAIVAAHRRRLAARDMTIFIEQPTSVSVSVFTGRKAFGRGAGRERRGGVRPLFGSPIVSGW